MTDEALSEAEHSPLADGQTVATQKKWDYLDSDWFWALFVGFISLCKFREKRKTHVIIVDWSELTCAKKNPQTIDVN